MTHRGGPLTGILEHPPSRAWAPVWPEVRETLSRLCVGGTKGARMKPPEGSVFQKDRCLKHKDALDSSLVKAIKKRTG